jgi:hypothetical protein
MPEAFHRHWREVHGPMVEEDAMSATDTAQLPGHRFFQGPQPTGEYSFIIFAPLPVISRRPKRTMNRWAMPAPQRSPAR